MKYCQAPFPASCEDERETGADPDVAPFVSFAAAAAASERESILCSTLIYVMKKKVSQGGGRRYSRMGKEGVRNLDEKTDDMVMTNLGPLEPFAVMRKIIQLRDQREDEAEKRERTAHQHTTTPWPRTWDLQHHKGHVRHTAPFRSKSSTGSGELTSPDHNRPIHRLRVQIRPPHRRETQYRHHQKRKGTPYTTTNHTPPPQIPRTRPEPIPHDECSQRDGKGESDVSADGTDGEDGADG